ncbi:hypothetical protein ACIQ9Q_42535 [Streptomyces sp. NPDC094438]|uniref:hypothetical protein n=1 Tax=Streptomyces sp. NPDC094438 TaxID=3366061 RepID=UPI0038059179
MPLFPLLEPGDVKPFRIGDPVNPAKGIHKLSPNIIAYEMLPNILVVPARLIFEKEKIEWREDPGYLPGSNEKAQEFLDITVKWLKKCLSRDVGRCIVTGLSRATLLPTRKNLETGSFSLDEGRFLRNDGKGVGNILISGPTEKVGWREISRPLDPSMWVHNEAPYVCLDWKRTVVIELNKYPEPPSPTPDWYTRLTDPLWLIDPLVAALHECTHALDDLVGTSDYYGQAVVKDNTNMNRKIRGSEVDTVGGLQARTKNPEWPVTKAYKATRERIARLKKEYGFALIENTIDLPTYRSLVGRANTHLRLGREDVSEERVCREFDCPFRWEYTNFHQCVYQKSRYPAWLEIEDPLNPPRSLADMPSKTWSKYKPEPCHYGD